MSQRLSQTFDQLSQARKPAFIAYIAAGDPTLDRTLDIVLSLEKAGVDIVELGIPFSDPLADGIVNQQAAGRALEAGATTEGVFELIRKIRAHTNTLPIVLFTYLNPVYCYGYERFCRDASEAGADGLLLLDLPPDEAVLNDELSTPSPLPLIRLIAPTSPPERIEKIAKSAEGFIYYVSREGVTGAQTSLAEGLAESVQAIKAHTSTPVAVGFGISTPEQASVVGKIADGVVVGSAIVKMIGESQTDPALAQKVYEFVKPLVEASKSA